MTGLFNCINCAYVHLLFLLAALLFALFYFLLLSSPLPSVSAIPVLSLSFTLLFLLSSPLSYTSLFPLSSFFFSLLSLSSSLALAPAPLAEAIQYLGCSTHSPHISSPSPSFTPPLSLPSLFLPGVSTVDRRKVMRVCIYAKLLYGMTQ